VIRSVIIREQQPRGRTGPGASAVSRSGETVQLKLEILSGCVVSLRSREPERLWEEATARFGRALTAVELGELLAADELYLRNRTVPLFAVLGGQVLPQGLADLLRSELRTGAGPDPQAAAAGAGSGHVLGDVGPGKALLGGAARASHPDA
jgi:hypothetical protein